MKTFQQFREEYVDTVKVRDAYSNSNDITTDILKNPTKSEIMKSQGSLFRTVSVPEGMKFLRCLVSGPETGDLFVWSGSVLHDDMITMLFKKNQIKPGIPIFKGVIDVGPKMKISWFGRNIGKSVQTNPNVVKVTG